MIDIGGGLGGMTVTGLVRACVVAAACLSAAGCAQQRPAQIAKVSYSAQERDCLARAMYFESHRGSDDGMLAVGTVVANRVKSQKYAATFCGVVGQKGQFAPGVTTRSMAGEAEVRARRVADAVLRGKRHPGVKTAMFFHTAGRRYPYPNMHYVLVAGGNAFYEKRSVGASRTAARENARTRTIALAYAKADPTAAGKTIVVASLEPKHRPEVVLPPQRSPEPALVQTVAAERGIATPAPAGATPPMPPVPAPAVGAASSISPAPVATVATTVATTTGTAEDATQR